MKLSGALVLFFVVLAPHADVRARDQDPLVELNHQIVGPAWKTWSLRLERNGKIIEERWDWSSKNYHSVKARCKLKRVESEQALEASRQLLSSLPTTVDSGRPIPIDGPNKQLLVRQGREVHSSSWYSLEDANPSVEAQEFARAWDKIQALLTCGTKK